MVHLQRQYRLEAAGKKLMKFRIIGTRLLAAASTVGVALLITSCGASNTIDYVYVTSNLQNPGQINVYELNSESGQLYQIADSPYPAGRNPVYEVASPNGNNLYVANHDDNTVVMYAIGTDGKLYPLQTVTTPGTEPVALAMNSSGTALYVLDYYEPAGLGQPSYTDLNPGPGAVIVYPISTSTGTLGTPLTNGAANYWSVQCFPTNLTVTPNGNFVYVTNTNAVVVTTSPPVTGTVPTLPPVCPAHGTVSEFAVNGSTGTSGGQTVSGMTELTGSPMSTGTGSEPTGIVSDTGSGSIYVTDAALNQVYAYAVGSGGSLTLTATVSSGTQPMGALVYGTPGNPGNYLYVANYTDGSLSSYSLSGGVPTPIGTVNSGASGPLCMTVDPDVRRYVYISNYIGGKVGGAEIDTTTGALVMNKDAPYISSGQPTCVAAIKHVGGNPNGL